MTRTLRVFVSSRLQELAVERQAVAAALEAMNVDAFVFEDDAGARPGTIVGTYREELLACDVYLGLFWLGWGDYTNDEYRTATAAGLPCLIYEKPPGAEGQRDPDLTAFLGRIGHVEDGDVTTAWFDDETQLAEWVARDIDRLRDDALRRQIRVGGYVANNTGLGTRLGVGQPPVIKIRRPHLAACTAPPNPFVGRDRPLSRIKGALSDGSSPVGFRGEPGMGKSALLAQLVADIAAGYADGAVCVQAADHASCRDVLQDVWTRYHDAGDEDFVPTDTELEEGLAARHALVTVDDLQLPASDVKLLTTAMPQSEFVVTGAPADGAIDPLAYVRSVSLQGFTEDADVLTVFEADYGEAVPSDARAAVVAACQAAGGGPGHIRRLANDAWGSDAPLAEWAQSAAGPLSADQQQALRLVAAAGPAVAMPTGVAEKLGVTEEQLAALQAAGLVKAASPRYRLAAPPPGAADEMDAGWLNRIVTATAEWTQSASPDEVAESRAFVAWAIERAAEAGDHESVIELARSADDALVARGWWGAWGRLLESARSSAIAAQDTGAAGWALHQLGTRAALLVGHGAGSAMLHQATELRLAAGDLDGAALSQHNARVVEQRAPSPDTERETETDGEVDPTTRQPRTDGQPLPPPEVDPEQTGGVADVRPPVKRPWWRNPWVWGGLVGLATVAGGALVALDPFGGGSGASSVTPDDSVRVTGTGVLSPDTDRVDFGTLPVGESAAPKAVSFTNSGNAVLSDLRVTLNPTGAFFSIEDRCSGASLQPGARCELSVGFTASNSGSLEALLTVSSGDTTATSTLVGAGDFGVLVPSPDTVDFGEVVVGDQPRQDIALANRGGVDVVIGSVTLDGPQTFAVGSDCGRLAPGEECVVAVAFGPLEPGAMTANVIVAAGNEPLSIAVSGTGVSGILEVTESVDAGSVEVGQQAPVDAFVFNVGNGPLEIIGIAQQNDRPFSLESDGCTGTVLDPGQQCELGIVFTPETSGVTRSGLEVVAQSGNGPEQRGQILVVGTGTEEARLVLDRGGVVDVVDFDTLLEDAEPVLVELLGQPDSDSAGGRTQVCFGSDERILDWGGFRAVFSAPDAGNDDVFGPQRFVGWFTTSDIDSTPSGRRPGNTVLGELVERGGELELADNPFGQGQMWRVAITDGADAGINFYFANPPEEVPSDNEPVLVMASTSGLCGF